MTIGQPLNLPRPQPTLDPDALGRGWQPSEECIRDIDAMREAEVHRVLDGANRLAILMGRKFVLEPWKLRQARLSEASVARVCGGRG